jgi:hypothetical protein
MLEQEFISSVTSEKLTELATEGAELALDSLLNDGVLKNIPFFSSLHKMHQAYLGIRESIFARKVYRFLNELKDIPANDRKSFIEKLDGDSEFNHRVGEKLIVILDRLDDLDKPTIIGRLFRSAIQERIRFVTFLKLSSIVDRAFLPELLQLKGKVDERGFLYFNQHFSKETTEHFYAIGIMSMVIKDDKQLKHIKADASFGGTPKDEFIPKLEYEINKLGEKIVKFGIMENYTPNIYDRD